MAFALTASCGGISQLDHTGDDPCTKASCAGDRWWVAWAPPVYTADSELVGSYAITVADADSGIVLEDHSFGPEYETVGVRDCDTVEPGSERITCTHFVASWD